MVDIVNIEKFIKENEGEPILRNPIITTIKRQLDAGKTPSAIQLSQAEKIIEEYEIGKQTRKECEELIAFLEKCNLASLDRTTLGSAKIHLKNYKYVNEKQRLQLIEMKERYSR